MQRFYYLAIFIGLPFIVACEDDNTGKGVQIGNEGVIDPDACEARTLSGDEQPEGWPGTVEEVTDALFDTIDVVDLDVDGTLTKGTLQLQAVAFRIGVDGDCGAIVIDVASELDVGDVLMVPLITGELVIDVSNPDAAVGVLEAADWSGNLADDPTVDRTLLFDTKVDEAGIGAEVIQQDCPGGETCAETSLGVLTSE